MPGPLGDIMDIAVSGLSAQRTRIAVTASNLANADTTRTPEGGPYRRRDPVFVSDGLEKSFQGVLGKQLHGVKVSKVVEDPRGFETRHLPGHPDADAEGIVRFPRVNIVEEQTNLMSASRSFEANLLVIRKVRSMSEAVMRIGQ